MNSFGLALNYYYIKVRGSKIWYDLIILCTRKKLLLKV